MDDDGSMGGRFWLKVFGIIIGVGIAVVLTFAFITGAMARWGLIAGFLVAGAVLLLAAWLYDRRQARIDREWGT